MSGRSSRRGSPFFVDPKLIEALENSRRMQPAAIAAELRHFNQLSRESKIDLAIFVAGRAIERVVRGLCNLYNVPQSKKAGECIGALSNAGHINSTIESHCLHIYKLRNQVGHADIRDEAGMTSAELQNVANGLNVVGGWYVRSVLPDLPDVQSFRVIEKHRISLEHLLGATEIGRLSYPEQYHSDHKRLWTWHEVNKDIFTLVEDTDLKRVAGCLTVLPLWDEAYSRIKAGTLIDVDLTASDIRKFDVDGFYKLYVASLIVHPAYQKSSVFKLLYDSYVDKLFWLAQSGIFVTELLADTVTDDGLRLANWLGMEKVGSSQHASSIYRVTLLPPTKLRADTGTLSKITKYYNSKYLELKELLDSLPAN